MTQKILVVDDEKSLQEFVSRNLSARGFEIFSAANGLEALAIFKAESLDLIILDLMMPHMNGLETCRRIRQTSMLPIIILSALDEESDKVKALDL
ncbi:MAG: response regulator, partial [Methylococcales bacterium]|nr:response regulator [Methylococcales bacterium]